MNIIDFNSCKENNKAYGGMAGSKLGIIYHGEDSRYKCCSKSSDS